MLCETLVIFGTFINPINKELDLVSVQRWSTRRHASAINELDHKAAFAIASYECGSAVSTFFEGIILAEVQIRQPNS